MQIRLVVLVKLLRNRQKKNKHTDRQTTGKPITSANYFLLVPPKRWCFTRR